jgi:hypothetical protein
VTAKVCSLADARRARFAVTRAERTHVIGVEHLEEVARRLRKWRTASEVRSQLEIAWRLLRQAESEGL